MDVTYIKDEFEKELPIQIDNGVYDRVRHFLLMFEQRQGHPEAFNSQLFGVTPVAFTNTDRETFFDIFGYKESTVAKIVDDIPSINTAYKVVSHPLNLFVIWAIHKTYASALSQDKIEKLVFFLGKILFYRYYTSLANHNFPYKADKDIMQKVVETLTRQSDIVSLGSWRGVIEESATSIFVDTKSLHHKTLLTFKDDAAILYSLSDTQTRIRSKIRKVVTAYYEIRDDKKSRIKSTSATNTIEGEKVLVETTSTMDGMINGTPNAVGNVNSFLRDKPAIQYVVRAIKYVPYGTFRQTLETISQMMTSQQKNGHRASQDMYIRFMDHDEFPNIHMLVQDIIRGTYRYARSKGIPESRKKDVLSTAHNVYTSSRIQDEDILSIRSRVHFLAQVISSSKRDATVSALRTGIILYILLKSFDYQ